MAFTNSAKETAALAVTAMGNSVSLHTADPGVTGTAEATGGSYARKSTTWTGGAVDGEVPGSQVTFDVPPGNYTHFGVWNGQTFIFGMPLGSAATFSQAGQLLVTPKLTATDVLP